MGEIIGQEHQVLAGFFFVEILDSPEHLLIFTGRMNTF